MDNFLSSYYYRQTRLGHLDIRLIKLCWKLNKQELLRQTYRLWSVRNIYWFLVKLGQFLISFILLPQRKKSNYFVPTSSWTIFGQIQDILKPDWSMQLKQAWSKFNIGFSYSCIIASFHQRQARAIWSFIALVWGGKLVYSSIYQLGQTCNSIFKTSKKVKRNIK